MENIMRNTLGGGNANLALLQKIHELERREKFHVGDVINSVEICSAGDITSGNTYLRFQITLPKQIGDDITDVKLTSSKPLTIRGAKGYVNGFSYDDNVMIQDLWGENLFDNVNVMMFKQIGNIRIGVTKQEGFGNVDANTCIAVNIENLTIKFL